MPKPIDGYAWVPLKEMPTLKDHIEDILFAIEDLDPVAAWTCLVQVLAIVFISLAQDDCAAARKCFERLPDLFCGIVEHIIETQKEKKP